MIDPQLYEDGPGAVTARMARQFAGMCVLIFGAAFALSWYRHEGRPTTIAWVAGAVALLIGLPGLVYAPYIRPFFMAAVAVTRPIGHVVSIALLGLLYYGLLTPMALLFRLAGRDALALYTREDAPTYWTRRAQTTDVRRYLRQYQNQIAEAPTAAMGASRG
jgi:hypothetical protein